MLQIVPNHEQLYPTKLLSRRIEEYVLSDGNPPSENRVFSIKVTSTQVRDMVLALQSEGKLNNISPHYYVGTCLHETGFTTNEWDTEIATPESPHGFESVGAYQIGEEEAKRFGFLLVDMLDFKKATICMMELAEFNRNQLRIAMRATSDTPDPDYVDAKGIVWPGGTMRAYLAICHNHGLGYTRSSIWKYGMNWNAYKIRNLTDNIVTHSYAADCITGGSTYPTAAEQPTIQHRRLELTHPFMSGDDVRELQRHLKIAPDGVFGPATESALKVFQQTNNLLVNGVCNDVVWKILL